MVAQTEYTPHYEVSNNGRGGGNTLVQMIYLDKHREELQLTFKRSRPDAIWGQKGEASKSNLRIGCLRQRHCQEASQYRRSDRYHLVY